MHTEDQSALIAFLSEAASYAPLGLTGPVERIDTHISSVFLIGDRAFKLKHAVLFPYLDFSDTEKRRAAAATEVELNRRTAPATYLGLIPVLRDPAGGFRLGEIDDREGDAGDPDAVEWLVAMRRFDEAGLLDRMALEGRLEVGLMVEAAEEVASFHEAAEVLTDGGGADGLTRASEGVRAAFAEIAAEREDVFDAGKVARLDQLTFAAIDRVGPLLDERRARGRVRLCHGDLHLRNICLIDGRPAPFDCIEFSRPIASVDVLYDLAFLLMDLWHRDLHPHANATLNRYLEIAGDYDGVAALPLFLSSRAAIRAHVTGSMALEAEGELRTREIAEARAYLDLALELIAPPAPRLVAVGGLPGSGKTTLARALAPEIAPAPGAVILRSDVIRKELMGVDPLTRLPAEAYSADMTRRTFATLHERVRAVLAAGHSAIADAVNGRPADRAALKAIARETGVPFDGLWLDAPVARLENRVAAREADASDADVEVVRKVARSETGRIDWTRIDAGGTPEEVAAAARRAIAAPD